MDWAPQTPFADLSVFDGLKPSEVLYEFDGPRIFAAQAPMGELLCFLADDDGQVLRFIAAPTNSKILIRLKSGTLTVQESLDQPWVWFVDLDYSGKPLAAWKGTLSEAPANALPQKGVMLWPDLEPVFALRAIGEGLEEGSVPMSVIRMVIDGASTALKKVANFVFEDARRQGRKANTIRQFYDLPAIGFTYNSFEVAFRLPDTKQTPLSGFATDETCAAFSEMGQKLESALNWAIDTEANAATPLSIDLLEALEKLVPPKSGIVKSIEVRGRIFSDPLAKFLLTRKSSACVRNALGIARASQEKITTVNGFVREFDKDDLSFTLRETSDGKDHVCRFQPEYYDELVDIFTSDERVTISGMENIKTYEIDVSLISRELSKPNAGEG
jgi:hypothetical protein